MRLQRLVSIMAFILASALLSACQLAAEFVPTHIASLVPPGTVASGATGSAKARLTNISLTVEGDYKNLSSTVVSVRLESADGTSLYSLQASGGTTGTFSRTQDLSADQITALNNGQLVLVVYTENYPEGSTGELRGNLTPS